MLAGSSGTSTARKSHYLDEKGVANESLPFFSPFFVAPTHLPAVDGVLLSGPTVAASLEGDCLVPFYPQI